MRRTRQQRACQHCRAQKKRCSGERPCNLCARLGRLCMDRPQPGSLRSHQRSVTNNATTDQGNGADIAEFITPDTGTASTRIERPATSRLEVVSSAEGNQSLANGPSQVQENQQEDVGKDPAGNPIEPTSPYSWLHMILNKAGWSSQDSIGAPAEDASLASGIFSYGDAISSEPLGEANNICLSRFSWSTLHLLLDIFFERPMSTYRFLHMPSTAGWMRELHEMRRIKPAQHAICFIALAHGALYLTRSELDGLTTDEQAILSSNILHAAAIAHLTQEKGPPTIESVQVRLVQVHHLLASSRPTQAWYAFGTVVQLVYSLGLHRGYSPSRHHRPQSKLTLELGRRTFWSVYATDKYISISLGRPILMPDNLVSQRVPANISDEDLTSSQDEEPTRSTGDSLTSATICHALLARIVALGIEEQYQKQDKALIESILKNKDTLERWRDQLPVFLSGVVHPQTLIPTFRRQAIAMNTFYLHAVLLINRPAITYDLLPESSSEQDEEFKATIRSCVDACVDASAQLAERAVDFGNQQQKLEVHWFTQNIIFNAVSILYIYILRNLQGRERLGDSETKLLKIAQLAQDSLAQATMKNAPCLRYTSVLTQLKAEVLRQISSSAPTQSEAEGCCDRGLIPNEHNWLGPDVTAFDEELPTSFWQWFDDLPT